jgi:hypothetical protein
MIDGYVLRHADKGVLTDINYNDDSDPRWGQPPAMELVFKNYPRAIKVWMSLPPEDQEKVDIEDTDGHVIQKAHRAPEPQPRK